MELVEGETLEQRISRSGALPAAEAIRLARQMVDGLDAAHEKGVVHRDLKPANIKITPQGVVTVLDFGLATARPSAPDPDADAATAAAITRDGVILGTAAYMSPEQARGHAVDKRTDIWAFGCVCYEMLTGVRPFAAPTMTDTIAAILTTEPDWTRSAPDTPSTFTALVRHCLQKHPPDNRYVIWTNGSADLWLLDVGRDATTPFTSDSSVELHPVWAFDGRRVATARTLTGISTCSPSGRQEAARQSGWCRARRRTLSAIGSTDGRVLLYLRGSAPSQNLETGSAELWALPLGGQAFPVVRAAGGAGQGQFSPSGKWIAFRATESRRPEVYIQRFPDGDKISVSTSGGVQPRWRSDGKELYYLGPDNRLMTVAVDVEGQTPVIGAPTPLFAQHWSFVPQGNSIQNYSVSRDGQRFLVDVYEQARVPVTVLLNWTPAN